MTNVVSEHEDSRDYRKEFEKSMAAIAASQEKFDARSAELQEKFDADMDEIRAAHKEGLAEMKEIRAAQKETERYLKETARQLRVYQRTFNTQWGRLTEALVEGRLVDVLKGWGIEVEFTRPGLEQHYIREDGARVNKEFDILAVNGSEMVVVEVKTTMKPKDVKHFLSAMRDIEKFYPDWAYKRVYGAMAYIKCDAAAEVQAEKNGLFVIRAVGEGAIITNDKDFEPTSFTGQATGVPHLRAVPVL